MSILTINNNSVITLTNQTIYIDNITCVPSGGDGPTNYSNYCTGNKPFNISMFGFGMGCYFLMFYIFIYYI